VIFVDTSVWIRAFRDAGSREAQKLRHLLDDDQVALAVIVRLEILAGARRRERADLAHLLSALPLYAPAEATWSTIEAWIDKASDAGERFGIADLVIAATAAELRASIWSLDDDFARMSRIGLVRTFTPK
jgi:predicted nucleic acid-binding protein